MHNAGNLEPVLCDNLEGWGAWVDGRGLWDGGVTACGQFVFVHQRPS